MIQGDINLICIGWFDPVIAIEYRKHIEAELVANIRLTRVFQQMQVRMIKRIKNWCQGVLTATVF